MRFKPLKCNRRANARFLLPKHAQSPLSCIPAILGQKVGHSKWCDRWQWRQTGISSVFIRGGVVLFFLISVGQSVV